MGGAKRAQKRRSQANWVASELGAFLPIRCDRRCVGAPGCREKVRLHRESNEGGCGGASWRGCWPAGVPCRRRRCLPAARAGGPCRRRRCLPAARAGGTGEASVLRRPAGREWRQGSQPGAVLPTGRGLRPCEALRCTENARSRRERGREAGPEHPMRPCTGPGRGRSGEREPAGRRGDGTWLAGEWCAGRWPARTYGLVSVIQCPEPTTSPLWVARLSGRQPGRWGGWGAPEDGGAGRSLGAPVARGPAVRSRRVGGFTETGA